MGVESGRALENAHGTVRFAFSSGLFWKMRHFVTDWRGAEASVKVSQNGAVFSVIILCSFFEAFSLTRSLYIET